MTISRSNVGRNFFGPVDGLMIARGLVPGLSLVDKFGRNAAVGASMEDIWGVGGTWVAPTSAVPMSVASSDANDDGSPVGTGARTLTIYGLNASYVPISETITLNGVGAVVTTSSFIHVNRAIVATAGTSESNIGTITITASGGGNTVQGSIVPLSGQTRLAIYQVPAGYTGYVMHTGAGAQDVTANALIDVEFLSKPFGGAWNVKRDYQFYRDGTGLIEEDNNWAPIVLTEKSLFKVRASASAGSADINATFDIVLEVNA